ncbi:BON domain-containing protein [Nesterenkonia sp. YGD6]|uniref:BON domain-containing protein n=1 Tax=Nesterenkonia sp. YGD6 TaxID=2901231 RepID=UPI001F4C58AF|nr:BON domain-containing protein [Nesterenkonia sp. YGD6]
MKPSEQTAFEHELETADDRTPLTHTQESNIQSEANAAIVKALARSTNSPSTVEARVENFTAVLTGQVDWNFQRELAKRAVENVAGVKHVEDQTTLRVRTPIENAADRVKKAMSLNQKIDASHVIVTITGNTAVFTGYVRSLAEKKQASLATWVSPDVTRIDNRLAVRRIHFAPFRRRK